MLSVGDLCLDLILLSAARLVEFLTLYCLLSVICLLSNFTRCLAILYVGAFTLLITGLIGIPVLCSFSCAFKIGADGFCCIRYFIFLLSMIRLHCCNVLC